MTRHDRQGLHGFLDCDTYRLLQSFFVIVAGLLAPSESSAQDKTRILGYGSVGYSLLINTEGQEPPYGETFGGASKKGTFRNLTRFGLNLTHEASENTSILIQLAASGSDLFHGTDEEHQFNVRANLAGLKLQYELLEIMLGILPTGYFMISDTMQMGATYLWAQPPKVFYRVGDTANVVGARMRKSFDLVDEHLLTLELLTGEMLYRKWYDSDTRIDSRSSYLYSLGMHLDIGDHNLRLTYTLVPEMHFTRSEFVDSVLSPGNPPIRIEAPGGCSRILIDGITAGYDGYLSEDIRIQGEFVRRRSHFNGCYGSQVFREKVRYLEQAGYIAFAYTIGSWTPRFLILKQNIELELEEAADLFASRFPAAQRSAARAGYVRAAKLRIEEKTDSFGLGLNYQITPYIVAKAEVEHYIAPDENIRGYQMDVDSSATLFNIAVDYVF